MNIPVTGANGQLGNEMRVVSKSTNDNYTFTDVVEAEGVETILLDITDAEAVGRMVKEKGIGCIVNCAAYTNVDKAESDGTLCCKLNAEAPRILAEAMKEVNGLLVQISTDYVLAATRITLPAGKTRREPRPGFMAAPNWKGRSASRPWVATMSLSGRPGSTQSSERTS